MRFFLPFLFLFCFSESLVAQSCSGNFGEPVVNLTFGSGVHPGPSQSTNYNYNPNDCPNDGSYTIIKGTSGCFTNAWHTLNQDHTPGDTDGYMMLVNASNLAGEFFRQTIPDLCPGTTYEFSAYIVNVLRLGANAVTRPNLTFTIETTDGIVLNKYETGVIMETASPEWKKYALIFSTTASISAVVLRIVNNAPGGNGNDLALDDITFRACGPTILPSVNAGQPLPPICPEQPFSLTLDATVSPGYLSPAYQWQVKEADGTWQDIPGANTKAAQISVASANLEGYLYRLAVAESFNINSVKCRILSSEIAVKVLAEPEADAGIDLSTMQNRPVQLQGTAEGSNITYRWTPSDYLDDPGKLDAIATPPADITYTLEVTDGCSTVYDEVFVKVYEEIVVPNAFSPNGDGVNDIWNIAGLISYPEASIAVYNRYGNVLFRSAGYPNPWAGTFKGKQLPTGTYMYVIDLKTSVVKGTVTIVR